MSAEQRNLLGYPASLIQRYDSKGTTARGVPIDRDVFGVGLVDEFRSVSKLQNIGSIAFVSRWRTLTKFVSHALRLMCKLS